MQGRNEGAALKARNVPVSPPPAATLHRAPSTAPSTEHGNVAGRLRPCQADHMLIGLPAAKGAAARRMVVDGRRGWSGSYRSLEARSSYYNNTVFISATSEVPWVQAYLATAAAASTAAATD